MPLQRTVLLGSSPPAATLGSAFTTSISDRFWSPSGRYIDRMVVSFKGDTGTAAVTMSVFLDLLNTFQFKVNGVPRVSIRGRDLFALNAAFLGKTPAGFVADDTNDDCKIQGLEIPIWETVRPDRTYSWSATRVGQTNVDGEVIQVEAETLSVAQRAPLHIVEIPVTTAAATGLSTQIEELPRLGDLLGVLIFMTNPPGATTDAASVQNFQLFVNDQLLYMANTQSLPVLDAIPINPEVATDWGAIVLDNYRYIDLSKEPIDLRINKVRLVGDVQDTADAMRYIPIIQLPLDT